MSKIRKFIKVFFLIIRQPSLLNRIVDDNDVNKKEVINKYNLQNGLMQIDISDLIPDFDENIEPYSSLDGSSTVLDFALLKALAKKSSKCNYLEIGTWRGESVANVASVAEKCITINLPDEEMQRKGMSQKYIDLHRFFSKQLLNVKHIQANSLTFDFNSLNEKFDLIFIDGDHHYESILSDTRNAFKLMRDNKSMIVWHDYGNSPENIRWDVLKGILDGTPTEKHKYLYHVSNTLCAIYFTENIVAHKAEYPQIPNKHFQINIKVRKH